MNRKFTGLPAQRATPLPVPPARRWRNVIVLFSLLLGLVAMLLCTGPGPGDPDASLWETMAYRVEKHYTGFESAVSTVLDALLRVWRQGVINASWSVDMILLVGGVLVLAGCLMMSRRVGR